MSDYIYHKFNFHIIQFYIHVILETTSDSTATNVTIDTRPENIRNLEVSIDPSKTEERQRRTNESIQRYNKAFGSLDMNKSYKGLFELLWYSRMPCFDVKGLTSQAKDELSFLKKCFWKEEPISCNAIFHQRPTDQGICCSFNMKKADQIFKKSKYTEAVSTMQSKDAESAFETKDRPSWYDKNKEPNPRAGRNKGLTLIIDGHSNKVSAGTVSEDFDGFITMVDENDKFPLLSLAQLISRPGYKSNIKVDAIKLESKNEIRRYEPSRRNCYFPDEYNLTIHQNYSQFNCIFECKQLFASKCLITCNETGQECNCEDVDMHGDISLDENESCSPWFYPMDANRPQKICSPWNTEKFLKIIQKKIPDNLCQHCLPDCTTTNYETTIAYAGLRRCDRSNLGGTSMLCTLVDGPFNPAPWMAIAQEDFKNANQTIPWYLNTDSSRISKDSGAKRFTNRRLKIADERKKSNLIFLSESEGDKTYDAFKKDIGIVNIFFAKEKIMKYVTSNRMSNFEFLVQFGGTLGFYMGVSIISIIELLYWFIFRFLRN